MINQLNLYEKREEELKLQLVKEAEVRKIVYKNG